MLTQKQKSLFVNLGVTEEQEAEIRARHKVAVQLGAPKDFTTWLTKALQYKWRNDQMTQIYVGD
jgi:hypothetical protein